MGDYTCMRVLRVIVEGAAGLCAASYLGRWVFPLTRNSVLPFGGTPLVPVLEVAAIALIAVCVAILVRPTRLGWAVATAAPVVTALTLPAWMAPVPHGSAEIWMVFGAGLTLGGIALAVANASPAGRAAIAVGFAAGAVTTGPIIGLTLPADTRDADALLAVMRGYAIAIAVVMTVAALVALVGRGADRVPRAGEVGMFTACLLGGLLLVAGHRWLPGASMTDGVVRFDPYPRVGLAAVIGLVFLWYAYRRGGADAARWIVVALGLAAPAVLGTLSSAEAAPATALIAVAVLAAAAGTLLTAVADRLAPWDGIGVLAATAGWLLGSPYVLHRTDGLGVIGEGLLVAGTAFGLAAGATRLWRSTVDSVAGHTALGLALLMLASSALVAPAMHAASTGAAWGQVTPLPITALGLACAVALGLLFIAGRKRSSLSDAEISGNRANPL